MQKTPVLDFAILGLLSENERHGYELRRRLAEFGFWSVSFGSLYPALKRLERQGLIEAAPSTGRRHSYRLTPAGAGEFDELLGDEAPDVDDEKAFNLRLAFFRHLQPEERIEVLERRRASLVERRAEARSTLRRIRSGSKDRRDHYTLSLMEHGMASTEADIDWLDGLIARERKTESPRRATRRAEARPTGTKKTASKRRGKEPKWAK